jgi:hypothetical protein
MGDNNQRTSVSSPARRLTRQSTAWDKRINLTVSDDEHRVLSAAAQAKGLTTTTYVAQVSLAMARGGDAPERSMRGDALIEFMRARVQVRKMVAILAEAVTGTGKDSGKDSGNLLPHMEACMRAVRNLDEAATEIRKRLQ